MCHVYLSYMSFFFISKQNVYASSVMYEKRKKNTEWKHKMQTDEANVSLRT